MQQGDTHFFWRLCLIGLFLNSYTIAHTQVEKQRANHWYFGNQYGFDFSSGTAQLDANSAMFTYESCVTMSDKSGQLLFYSNGGGRVDSTVLGNIWNRNHEVMEGGELGAFDGGGYSSAQGALSFLKPGTTDQYYLFTIDEAETINNPENPFPKGKGLSYFEIDMSANGGLGKVTLSNEKLLEPAFEHMSATRHGNCEDYWLLTRTGYGILHDDPTARDSFYLFKITETGIETPIKTPIPSGIDCSRWGESGMIRFAPDGNHFTCGVYLFDFDKDTGVIGSSLDLESGIGANPEFPLAFSSDGKLLYAFSVINEGEINAPIIKFFCTQFEVETSEVFFVPNISFGEDEAPVSTLMGTPQLAADGKMYIPFHHGIFNEPTRIYVVENPNTKGPDAQFHGPVFDLSPPLPDLFLRFGNYTDHIFYVGEESTIDLELEDSLIIDCQAIEPISVSAPGSFECMLWSTGDTSATIEILEEGLYWLEVVEGCEIGKDTFELIYENNQFDIELGNDTTLCEGEELLLVAEVLADADYLWQDSTDLPFLYVEEEGLYSVEVRLDNCYERDFIQVDFLSLPIADIGVDTTICEESELTLDASHPDNATYEWQDGSTAETFTIDGVGFYEVTVTNNCGVSTDEVFINLLDCEVCDIDFPNAFSPNQDGLSESFGIVTNCSFSQFNLKIFNRWGNIVFEGKDASENWDGTKNGKRSQTDVYFYLLEYETINPLGDKRKGKQSGELTLLR